MSKNTATAPTYTVWDREVYVTSTEVWSGGDFAKALQVVVDTIGSGTSSPLDHTAVVALRAFGTPVAAFAVVDPDGGDRTVFITR